MGKTQNLKTLHIPVAQIQRTSLEIHSQNHPIKTTYKCHLLASMFLTIKINDLNKIAKFDDELSKLNAWNGSD